MQLECVMVCVNYGDFLNITLEHNRKHFDKIVVVTVEKDIETINICHKNGANVVLTDRLYENGDKFNKGKAINDGLKELNRTDWVLITDADMIMAPNLRNIIKKTAPNTECIYGTTRRMCPDYDNWNKYLIDPTIKNEWVHQRNRKNIGVGFFQLVNGGCELIKDRYDWYNEDYGNCGRSDRIFHRMWPPDHRGKIRKASCIHLGGDELAVNWYGRVTTRFI